ncbi:MAG: response regulator [Gammaproteobacteria bacterium]|nr:response regulator [Gammaproteobacteria bacterium]
MSDWWEEAPIANDGEDPKPSSETTTDAWWDDIPLADDSSESASEADDNAADDWWQEAAVAESDKTPEPVSVPEATPVPLASEDEPDEEMVEIFLEEAIELQETMDTALQSWSGNANNLDQIPVLHRTLHTIKGGARMAGVNSLGDLSHAMESFLGGLENGTVKSSDAALQLAQSTADYIGTQIDALKDGRSIGAEPSLLAALEQALDKGEVDISTIAGIGAAEKVQPEPPASQPAPPHEEDVITEASLEDYEDSVQTDSRLLVDSQLMTNSELLQESQLLESELTDSSDFADSQSSEIIHFDPKKKKIAKKKQDRSREQVRVNAELLDKLVNNAGEVSIYRSRLEQQNSQLSFNLTELEQTVERLQKQLRQLEIETEAQILFRYERDHADDLDYQQDFDPLEMDRFSTMQELSRALSETVNDLTSINDATGDLTKETETLLLQQSRVSTDLQDGLMRTRMVPISQQMNRLQRVVRQTARSLDKNANLDIGGTVGEMDRNILESIMGPLEHLLRNAVAHGIEAPNDRKAADKPEMGKITLTLDREGTELVLKITDDGKGLNLEKIRKQAIEKGLMVADAQLPDKQVMQFILEAGFSTASEVTQISGRGVGMDVVTSELKQLGGSLEIDSEAGKGSIFSIHLPYTLAISDAMLVRVGEETYAVPHTSIEGVLRATRDQVEASQKGENVDVEYAGHHYQVRYLGTLLGIPHGPLVDQRRSYPVLLVRSGESRLALQVDHLIGNRQIVVKSVGAQLSTVRWITGGTIMGDGQVALIIDVNALVRSDVAKLGVHEEAESVLLEDESGITVMVVDDSITVRKVTSRLLARHNMEVITAKDGVDALDVLQDRIPDVVLLDVEMPRMDGFELARHMKNTSTLKHIPIIMITSRTGEKHRKRAMSIGVNSYLGKPYQEEELLENIYTSLAEVEL